MLYCVYVLCPFTVFASIPLIIPVYPCRNSSAEYLEPNLELPVYHFLDPRIGYVDENEYLECVELRMDQ